MNIKHMFSMLVLAGMLVCLALSGCSAPASASAPPEQVVEQFYDWHLGYPGNSIADHAYRDSAYLAPSFVREVDELLSTFDMGGFDPFLLAQDLPEEITADDTVITGDRATVVTRQRYGGNPNLRDVVVELALVGHDWKITSVSPVEVAQPAAFSPPSRTELADGLGVDPQEVGVEPSGDGYLVTLTPRGVAQAFYSWYLGYIGERGSDAMRNPLVDRAYRDSDYLTKPLIREVDELVNSFDKGGFDPFLLAQDIPQQILVGEARIVGDTATVEIYQHYAGNPAARMIVVELSFDDSWKITRIAAPDIAGRQAEMEPSEVIESFYHWYLAYIGDPATETFHDPLADRACRENELLTGRFIEQIDDLLASFNGAGYDPFLCAQDIPQALTATQLALVDGTAEVEVTTSFIGHSFRAELVDQSGAWKIDNIRCTFDRSE